MFHKLPRTLLISLALILFVAFAVTSSHAQDKDLSSNYLFKPVRIGAGGWMRGMAVSPSDATRRYARGDVDNVYRWDDSAQQWFPTKILGGLPSAFTAAPVNGGGGAIAIDPQNPDHVLVVYTLGGSNDLGNFWNLNVYYSTDGAKTFKPANLSLNGTLSQETSGERLAIDPNNGDVAYLGPPGAAGATDGFYRSTDGGITWNQVTGGGLPVTTPTVRYEFALPRFDSGSGTVSANGATSSKILYVTYITHDETNNDNVLNGGVLKSADGGQTWTDITGSVIAAGSGTTVSFATVDVSGNLWISDGSANIYSYGRSATAWTTSVTPHGGGAGIAVDQRNPLRIFTESSDGLSRSLDGGKTWTDLGGNLSYSSTQPIEWLRPSPIRPQGHYLSISGLYMDPNGNLWVACGNDGIITTTPSDATDSLANPPVWYSSSTGIEEMVAEIPVIPPGGKPVLTVEDETLFTITNPDTFTAQHYPINLWNNNNGLSTAQDISYVPNQPQFLAVTTDNLAAGNPLLMTSNFAGYSVDGGNTWSLFPSITAGTHPCILYDGSIAISARPSGHENDPAGSDNLVWIPTNFNQWSNFAQVPAPFYSKDGGATWTQTTSFNNAPGATSIASPCGSGPASYTYMGYQWGPWIFVLAQHLLVADPITPGTFYAELTAGGLWTSTDGGVTWTQLQTSTGGQVPDLPHHGTLAAVPGVSGDLWLVDGHEGSDQHGLYHSLNGGVTFSRNPNFDYAWALALGKAASGSTYPAIYVYGRLTGDANWGIFQSVDGGMTFNRISYYPYGIIDVPNSLAASWDVFGLVYVGFQGNSFVYGQQIQAAPPGPPTGLTAVAKSATEIDLSWTAPTGIAVNSYSIYRGTSSQGEAATPIQSGLTTTMFADTTVTSGNTYYYFVQAVNLAGASAPSNEASAMAAAVTFQIGVAGGGSSSATVTSGQTATYNLTVNSSNFAGTLTFACTGAPANATCNVPSPVTVTAATTATPFTITVNTANTVAMLINTRTRRSAAVHYVNYGLPLFAISFLGPLCFYRIRSRYILQLTIAALAMAGLCACGGNSSPKIPPVNATLTVTASSPGQPDSTISLQLTIN
jgi:hypothetical protein